MVSRGKPESDLFLHAARNMGAAPSACIVMEDSPAGAEAVTRAGILDRQGMLPGAILPLSDGLRERI